MRVLKSNDADDDDANGSSHASADVCILQSHKASTSVVLLGILFLERSFDIVNRGKIQNSMSRQHDGDGWIGGKMRREDSCFLPSPLFGFSIFFSQKAFHFLGFAQVWHSGTTS